MPDSETLWGADTSTSPEPTEPRADPGPAGDHPSTATTDWKFSSWCSQTCPRLCADALRAVNSLCSPQVGPESTPAFPSLLPEQPHTFRDEPFPKKPRPFLVLQEQALLWGTGLFCQRGNSHSGIITALVGFSSPTAMEVPTLSISDSSSQ